MGPYHFARMGALAQIPDIELTVVECTSRDDHGWRRTDDRQFNLVTLSNRELSMDVLKSTQRAFADTLARIDPDIVIAPGYAHPPCLIPILGYRKARLNSGIILWSESTINDNSRVGLKENVKAIALRAFDGALVAGTAHAQYLRQLRMPAENIQIVGNCVDNAYFEGTVSALKSRSYLASDGLALPPKCFLYVGRLIAVKNLATLIKSYAAYRLRRGSAAWDMVLVGEGQEESALRELVRTNSINGVHFAGLRQIEELPPFYARANCFVLPSTSEPWGLVINEAMASGLPILASNRCGCVPDLIKDGINGFTFDPFDQSALTEMMLKMSSGSVPIDRFGQNSRKIIANYTPSLFAQRTADYLKSLYQNVILRKNGRRECRLQRMIAEKVYTAFAASFALSQLTFPFRSRTRAS